MATLMRNTFQPDYVSPPGETLLEALEERGMSQAELAGRTGRSKKTINEIIQGKAPITPETALLLEIVLGIPARFWNQREQQYREALARLEDEKRLSGWTDWLKGLPIKDMIRRGWIIGHKDPVEQVRELLQYFRVASPDAWQTVWEQEAVAFRKSATLKSDFASVAVWLRQGEIEAEKLDCASYDARAFREALDHLRGLTVQLPDEFRSTFVEICAHTGVAVVFVPELPKVGVWGATRWLTQYKALIQLSLRYKTDDHLWFTFFHEAGHILLHGKRDTFLEQEPSDPDEEHESESLAKEREANQFAADLLIPPARWRQFTSSGGYNYRSKADISRFADELGIAPGIVVGRLQHERLLPFAYCNDLKLRLTWPQDEEGI